VEGKGVRETNLSEISTLAAAVSACAVPISLTLLARQLRQARRNQQALIQQGRAGRSVEIAMRLVTTDFAEAYHSCMSGDPQITDTQLVQFIGYCRAVFLGAEDSYLQHKQSLLDESAFNSFNRTLSSLLESPGMGAAWMIVREWYDGKFAAHMDGVVQEANNRPPSIQNAQWRAAVSQLNGVSSSRSLCRNLEVRHAA
jgi:hypothetical protein